MHLLAAVASLGRLLRFSSARRHKGSGGAAESDSRYASLRPQSVGQGKTVDKLGRVLRRRLCSCSKLFGIGSRARTNSV